MKPQLEQIKSWARTVGQMAIEMRKEDLDIEQKGLADLVTRADKAIEAYLLDQVATNFPKHIWDPMHVKDEWYYDRIGAWLHLLDGCVIQA